jgi:hypothetical protein
MKQSEWHAPLELPDEEIAEIAKEVITDLRTCAQDRIDCALKARFGDAAMYAGNVWAGYSDGPYDAVQRMVLAHLVKHSCRPG